MHLLIEIIGVPVIAAAVLVSVIALYGITPRPHRIRRRSGHEKSAAHDPRRGARRGPVGQRQA